jgi:CheY-like chemotaxis protein
VGTHAAGPRVLVVEDDEQVRSLLCRILESYGYRTAESGNGISAFAQLRLSPPHVVVLDLMMPAVNGFQVAQRMREHPIWRTIPIIVMTASIHLEDQIRAMDPRIVLRKPFSMEELLDAVAAVLPSPDAGAAADEESTNTQS